MSPAGGEPAAAPKPSIFIRIFKGPDEIRAGWRLLAYLAIILVLGAGAYLVVSLLNPHHRAHPVPLTPMNIAWGEGFPFLIALFAAGVMGRLERRTLAQYGLPWRKAFGASFWEGALWGFLALTVLLMAIRVAGGFSFGGLALHGVSILTHALPWALGFLVVGFSEEFLFRGYALFTASTGIGFWPSAILLSLSFGAVHLHNIGESWVGALGALLIGLFFCLTLRRTGSLWFAIGLHAAWDFAETFIYAVPDSGFQNNGLLHSSFYGPAWLTGGAVGPEGSGFLFILMAGLFLIFDRTHREVRFPVRSGK